MYAQYRWRRTCKSTGSISTTERCGARRTSGWTFLDYVGGCSQPDEIHRIRFFTALVGALPNDPGAPRRQSVYLRALRTIPNLEIHLGLFRSHSVRMPLADVPATGPRTVQVIKTEERGSDVNLASLLLMDAFDRDCDVAVVVSNDADLCLPIELARMRLGLKVGIVNPHPARLRSQALRGDFFKQLRVSAVAQCQFPAEMNDGVGAFRKPAEWQLPQRRDPPKRVSHPAAEASGVVGSIIGPNHLRRKCLVALEAATGSMRSLARFS